MLKLCKCRHLISYSKIFHFNSNLKKRKFLIFKQSHSKGNNQWDNRTKHDWHMQTKQKIKQEIEIVKHPDWLCTLQMQKRQRFIFHFVLISITFTWLVGWV